MLNQDGRKSFHQTTMKEINESVNFELLYF